MSGRTSILFDMQFRPALRGKSPERFFALILSEPT